ncbi:hypothetical protein SAMN05444483_108103 [Salegentibacter echinorum]|uniref:Uncharacterized protein n=1 Tax=Salegentibacter echinorum TaxID=1073325 RepID=A0A1M5IRL1_SALEC|nr:hypothetical protein [Salegentibacter echinorum]SHG30964.1 hypothetical protein SAMN05444483_108103 [Salegentibacter echinorum]
MKYLPQEQMCTKCEQIQYNNLELSKQINIFNRFSGNIIPEKVYLSYFSNLPNSIDFVSIDIKYAPHQLHLLI